MTCIAFAYIHLGEGVQKHGIDYVVCFADQWAVGSGQLRRHPEL